MKIGFIGFGNMAFALVQGLLTKNFPAENIIASSRTKESLEKKAQALKIKIASDNQSCIDESDIIFLGLKPEDLPKLKVDFKNKPIISMAAKRKIEDLKKLFGEQAFCRIMPNLNVAINQGSIAYFMDNIPADKEKNIIELLNLLGKTYAISEEDFSAFTALAGSSPALFYYMIDLMSASVSANFDKKTAVEIVATTMLGSALTSLKNKEDLKQLVKNVASKGGTTIEGLKVFDEYNFEAMIYGAMQAIIKKDKNG